jgi:hypothetical protein
VQPLHSHAWRPFQAGDTPVGSLSCLDRWNRRSRSLWTGIAETAFMGSSRVWLGNELLLHAWYYGSSFGLFVGRIAPSCCIGCSMDQCIQDSWLVARLEMYFLIRIADKTQADLPSYTFKFHGLLTMALQLLLAVNPRLLSSSFCLSFSRS